MAVSRIAKKFMVSVSIILVLVMAMSVYLNSNFIERYFLYMEKRELNAIADRLVEKKYDIEKALEEVEKSEDVVIAWVENSKDNGRLNGRLRKAFLDKGLGLDEYWLWNQDQEEIFEKGRKLKVYNQSKFHYSLMVKYLDIGEDFVAIAKIVPMVSSTIRLINWITGAVFTGATFVIMVLLYFLVKRITVPLKEIGDTANAISMLDFKMIEVKTNDELEKLAQDINNMSLRLRESHGELRKKNCQMESLLSNVSHDLKTPISVIKAYSSGMKDGMDDGGFLDVIISQNEKMERLVKRLLEFSKINEGEIVFRELDLSEMLVQEIGLYMLQVQRGEKSFVCDICEDLVFKGDLDIVLCIFSNLISNGVKYSEDGCLHVSLNRLDDEILFCTRNKVAGGEVLKLDRLWDAFYVGEESRNDDMSGTGLGLALVKACAERCGFDYSCALLGDELMFIIKFYV